MHIDALIENILVVSAHATGEFKTFDSGRTFRDKIKKIKLPADAWPPIAIVLRFQSNVVNDFHEKIL